MIAEEDLKQRILEVQKGGELVRIPAAEQDYLKLAYEVPFKIEYHNSEIIAMGLASFIHEELSANLIFLLKSLFLNDNNVKVLGSSLGIHKDKFEGGYYLPDVSLVIGRPDFVPNTTSIITNPSVVFEVLSPSTKSFDLSEKLEEYKLIESIEQIVFVYQDKIKVTSYRRSYKPLGWLNQDFVEGTDSLEVNENQLLLSDIYRDIDFANLV